MNLYLIHESFSVNGLETAVKLRPEPQPHPSAFQCSPRYQISNIKHLLPLTTCRGVDSVLFKHLRGREGEEQDLAQRTWLCDATRHSLHDSRS